ncbi:hypothetical protein [Paeniglutamicibacter psychrophenolicus]|uniref:hypothetical protein n=1 Tax=Paeniglutamicibacter psychrophenolicus TaxID=257454 RepID=UPI00277F6944|nr:hypothetical protein [Paeniglutamicibacter psychrophenolicus]MDQ0093059.1 hypothetical protein [Paeniglutamicibacter psychrophenolicus]
MSIDMAFGHHPTQLRNESPWEPRLQNSAAASSASSPGRRTRALRAPDTPARGNHDTFTHQGTAYELIRFYPGDAPAQAVPHHRATAEIPTNSGNLVLPVEVTARTTHLVHVAWTDDTGELVGTWCPTDMVRTELGPRN